MALQRLRHFLIQTTGLPGVLARPAAHGLRHASRRVDAQGLFQLFLFDPNGAKLEPNLDGAEAEAAGIAPAPMAGDLPR